MEPEIIAAFIALLGVILSALITVIINAGQTRYNYKQLFAETVSKNRMDWINVWRENIARVLACAEVLKEYSHVNFDDASKILEYKKEFYEARSMITSRLNMNEELHILMFAAINQIDFESSDTEFVAQREYILELARKILKPEWSRVKDEAKGKHN